jgi:toxin ParE1/3/4
MARRRRAAIWSQEARTDLSEIWGYYAKIAGRPKADEIAREISNACRLLEEHAFAGRARDEIRPGLRSIASRPYVIFYRVRGGVGEIVRVLHGRRDLEDMFAGDSTSD